MNRIKKNLAAQFVHGAHQRRGGFTLVEVLIASALSAIILVGVLTTFISLVRGFVSLSNYVDMHKQTSKTLNVFAKDMREVSNVASFTSSYLRVSIPTNFTASGTVVGTNVVTYSYSSGALYRTETVTGLTRMQLTNITTFAFSLFDRYGSNTTALGSAKGVKVNFRLRKDVQGKPVSEDGASARYCLRNIP